jgi:hypothetical protein
MRNLIDAIKAWFGYAPRAVVSTEATTWIFDSATTSSLAVSAIEAKPAESVEAVLVTGETVDPAPVAAVHHSERRMSLRLRSVGRLNKKSRRRKPVSVKTRKRAPDLYPMKRRPALAKKPVLKVLQAKPKVRPSAMIIPFPAARIRKARLKLAA